MNAVQILYYIVLKRITGCLNAVVGRYNCIHYIADYRYILVNILFKYCAYGYANNQILHIF